jgi:hypothetical protein
MEEQLDTMRRQMQALQSRLDEAADAMRREVERIERSHRLDLVPVTRTQVVHIGRRRRHA